MELRIDDDVCACATQTNQHPLVVALKDAISPGVDQEVAIYGFRDRDPNRAVPEPFTYLVYTWAVQEVRDGMASLPEGMRETSRFWHVEGEAERWCRDWDDRKSPPVPALLDIGVSMGGEEFRIRMEGSCKRQSGS